VKLCIETSTRMLSLSLVNNSVNNREIAKVEILAQKPYSQNIALAVDFMLKSVARKIQNISEVYAGTGPGSFTGIRVGLTFANTLHQFLGIPLLGIPTLDLLAFSSGKWYNPTIVFLKSRRDEVFCSFYCNGNRKADYMVLKMDDFRTFIEKNNPEFLVSTEDGFEEFGELINQFPSCHIIRIYPHASALVLLAREKGLKPRPEFLHPMYLRGF